MKKNAIAGVCFNAYSNYFQCIIGLISSLYHIQNKLFKSRCGANRIDESKKNSNQQQRKPHGSEVDGRSTKSTRDINCYLEPKFQKA